MSTIGIIGAGNIGQAFARALARHGMEATISNSRGPGSLGALVKELGSTITAGTREEAAARDIVLVAVNWSKLPAALAGLPDWNGRIVIDANNPIEAPLFKPVELNGRASSEVFADLVPDARVVKAFNHIYASQLTTDGRPAGTPNRRALAIAGDDPEAKRVVTQLLDQFGFDTVDAGPLREGWRIQRDTPGYGPRRNAEELRADLAAARRYAEMKTA